MDPCPTCLWETTHPTDKDQTPTSYFKVETSIVNKKQHKKHQKRIETTMYKLVSTVKSNKIDEIYRFNEGKKCVHDTTLLDSTWLISINIFFVERGKYK